MHPIEFKNNLKTIPMLPSRPRSEKKIIVLIPIFHKGNLEAATSFCKSAAWTLYTFLSNTDADVYGVDCQLYIEKTAMPACLPILEENRIAETDVKIFQWPHTDWYGLSQKLFSFYDDRLLEYDYVFEVDADCYVIPSIEGQKLPIFKNIIESDMNIALNCVSVQDGYTSLAEMIFMRLLRLTGYRARDILESLEIHTRHILSTSASKKTLEEKVKCPTTFLFIFKPQEIRKCYPYFLSWFQECGYQFDTDEEILRLAHLLGYIDFDMSLKKYIPMGRTNNFYHNPEAYLAHQEITEYHLGPQFQETMSTFYSRIS